jgi:hypothetical protein
VIRRLRAGECVVLAGAICLIVSMFVAWYSSPIGNIDMWDTFGPASALILAALCAGLAVVVSALAERGNDPSMAVATAVWSVALGLAGTIAAIVKVLERPDNAGSTCAGVWLGLAGTLAVLVGAWLVLRDERPSLYSAANPEPRPRP